MKIDINKIKPNPRNDEIYDPSDLTELKGSIETNGQLEPIVINKKNIIISGHRRYYSMYQMGIQEVEVSVKEFDNDMIALIEFNRQRQKTATDILRESNFLEKEYKSVIGRGKRTDIGGGKKERSDQLTARSVGVSLTQLKQLKSINNYAPELLKQINDGELSINKAYQMVRNEHILPSKLGMTSKTTKTEFKRRFQKLLNEFEPQHSEVMSIVNKQFPKELLVSSDSKLDYQKKKDEIVEHLEYLKQMNIEQYLLYKKFEEVEHLNKKYSQKDYAVVEQKLWKPRNPLSVIDTIEDIENLDPFLVVVSEEAKQKEFTILRKMISTMSYDVNPGRHIKIIVMDKNTDTYLGALVLSSDFHTLEARDKHIGWTKDNKFKDGRLKNTCIMSTIVPTQPFGFNFLGGKLLACLTTTDEIRKIWKDKYGDVLVGITTTSLYGSYSMYNSIPYWKKLGSSKGTALIKPNDEVYMYWYKFLEKNYSDEMTKAKQMTSPKQKVLKLMYDVLSIDVKKLQNTFTRGIYFSSFYNNTNDFLCGDCAEDELILKPKFNNNKSEIMEWWIKKAIKRYNNLINKNNLQTEHLWYSRLTKDDIQKYLNATKLFDFTDI